MREGQRVKKSGLSSRLKKRIVIEKPVVNSDGMGGYDVVWQNFKTVWAEINPVQGVRDKEYFVSGHIESRNAHKITMRFFLGLTPNMRIVISGRVLNIRAIMNDGEENKVLQVYAEEGVNI